MTVWSLLLTENERNLRLGQPACSLTRKTDFSDSAVLSAFCTKNGAGRSGDISGDKLGGLTCRRPKPRRAAALQARSSALRRTSSGTGPLLRTFSTFAGRKRNSEHGERLEPDFDRKRANLVARAPHFTSDTGKLFGVGRFQRRPTNFVVCVQ